MFTTDVSKSRLPLKVSACHCTSCRHLTGALYSTDASWPGERGEVLGVGLGVYHFSGKIDVSYFLLLSCFCRTGSGTVKLGLVIVIAKSN